MSLIKSQIMADIHYVQAQVDYRDSKLSPMTGHRSWLYGIWQDAPTKFPISLVETIRLDTTFSLVQFLWSLWPSIHHCHFCLCSWRVLWWTPPKNKQVLRLFKLPADQLQLTIACCAATSCTIQYCKIFWVEKGESEVKQMNLTLMNAVPIM